MDLEKKIESARETGTPVEDLQRQLSSLVLPTCRPVFCVFFYLFCVLFFFFTFFPFFRLPLTSSFTYKVGAVVDPHSKRKTAARRSGQATTPAIRAAGPC